MLRHAILAMIFPAALIASTAFAQEEIPPPDGKGRIVMVLSGQSGITHYHRVAEAIARMGYDVLLYDGNTMAGSHGEALRTALAAAPSVATHALPGQMGLVGFSLGGGVALGYGSLATRSVAVNIDWYPATRDIADSAAFAGRVKVPTLVLAGESDSFRDCCVIAKAREIGAAATAAGTPLTLVTYPGADHDFVIDGNHYNSAAYMDGLSRTEAMLKQYLN